MFDQEDEVDWSDGTLGSPPPLITGSTLQSPAVDATEPVNHSTQADESAKSPGLPTYLQNIIGGHPAASTAAPPIPPRIAIEKNRPTQPSPEDISRFALYQANQKTYEAMFLKTFIAHALHSKTLDLHNSLADKPGVRANLENYLQSVTENVNDLTDKMIWNAHFKSLNFLARSGDTSLPFVNLDRFKQDLFDGFGPQRTYPVADKMNQSWHRTNSRLNMVQYSAEDYPIEAKNGKGRSPFDEHQEALRALSQSTPNNGMPKGRVFEFPSGHSNGNNYLEDAGVLAKNGNASKALLGVHQVRLRDSNPRVGRKKPSTLIKRPLVKVVKKRIPSSQATATEVLREVKRVLPGRELRRLEAYVARSDPVSSTTKVNAESSATTTWAAKIYNVQKQRLAQKRIAPNQSGMVPRDIKSIVAWAVSNNILKPPSPRVQSQIDARASRNRVQLKPTRPCANSSLVGDPATSVGVLKQAVPSAAAPGRTNAIENSAVGQSQEKGMAGDSLGKAGGKRKNRQASGSRKKKPRTGSEVTLVAEDPGKGHAPNATPTQSTQSGAGPQAKLMSSGTDDTSLPPHPSGSTTLEPHQILPPDAYFEKNYEDEKFAWRCGVKHPLGHYYIAGDRSSCPGCNTNVKTSQHTRKMDFYLPSMQYFTQPAPGVIWKPGKPYKTGRKYNTSMSHNSVGKDAYWAAITSGSDPEGARQAAVIAIHDYLERKARVLEVEPPSGPEPEHTPEPDHTPEPEHISEPEPTPPPMPHPSGSRTMEHGQDIPDCHYFSKQERHEEFAWRCDGGHALGRYYMAGDKRSCPGCGLHRDGFGRHTEMDFYMPSGTAIRQEAPGLVTWKPRKPYRPRKTSTNPKPAKKKCVTKSHNQLCTTNYWKAIDSGLGHEDALQTAIQETMDYLDAMYTQSESDASEGAENDDEPQRNEPSMTDSGGDGLDDEMVGIENASMQGQGVAEDMPNAYGVDTWGQIGGVSGEKTAVSILDDSSDDDTSSSGSDSE